MPLYAFSCPGGHTKLRLRAMGDKTPEPCECGQAASYDLAATFRGSWAGMGAETHLGPKERQDIYDQTGRRFERVSEFDRWAEANDKLVLRPGEAGVARKNAAVRNGEAREAIRRAAERGFRGGMV